MSHAIPEWRAIPGYEGLYEVSNCGQIRGVDRIALRPQGNLPIRGRMLKPAEHPTGHRWVNLRKDSASKKMYVHRAVATAFIGPIPEGLEVRHLDGDATNNQVDNLAYGTRSENMWDRVHHGRHPNAAKTHCVSGHAFDADNTYYRRGGKGRSCRKCGRSASRRSRRRKETV